MADLDTTRLIKVLGMLGSSHDGEKLAALARAEAMLKAAGKTWGDVVGMSHARSAGGDLAALRVELQAQRIALARERAAFQSEKALWASKQQAWRSTVSKDQEERLKKQHEEDLVRHRATNEAWQDDPRYAGEDDTPQEAGEKKRRWESFVRQHAAEAAWIEENISWEFAASLFQFVQNRGGLTAKQMDAVQRGIERAEEGQYRRRR